MKAFAAMSLNGAGAGTSADDVPSIGVGMLGYAFMGKAHSHSPQRRYRQPRADQLPGRLSFPQLPESPASAGRAEVLGVPGVTPRMEAIRLSNSL